MCGRVWVGGVRRVRVGGSVGERGVIEASVPPPVGGGTREAVVPVQGDGSSGFRPSSVSFPPPNGGGTREVAVQVRGGGSSCFRPSPASFPPPDGGGTRKVVQVRPGVIRSRCWSTVLIPPPAGGGTPEGVSDQSRAVAGGRLRVVAILSSVWHPNWRVSGGVLRCEPRTCGQAPPAPAVLSPEKNAPG